MTWWDSLETLSRMQTVVAILIFVLGGTALAVKLRADDLKKQADTRKSVERARLDQELQEQTRIALQATKETQASAQKVALAAQPRRLLAEKLPAMLAALSGAPKLEVALSTSPVDEEARDLTGQIRSVLNSAQIAHSSSSVMQPDLPAGIVVSHGDTPEAAALADAISKAISIAGIASTMETKGATAFVGVFVGRKP
ncbi:MAG: hypothetical protein U0984_09675 [Prosthecobacter sp.]|nr:hypothetical protein [Prosthecobacter sp.]